MPYRAGATFWPAWNAVETSQTKGSVITVLSLVGTLLAPTATPSVSVVANPVEKRALKADVAPCLLGFQPLVPQDFLTLGEKFLIEAGTRNELLVLLGVFGHVNPRDQQRELHADSGICKQKEHDFRTMMLKIEFFCVASSSNAA